jgi:adenosine kinase
VERKGAPVVEVGCPQEDAVLDPTGVGDAFRAGFVAGLAWGVSDERCAQVGSMLATHVIETVGTQEYVLSRQRFLERITAAYGDDAAADIGSHIRCPLP